jgi:hypothetical protein
LWVTTTGSSAISYAQSSQAGAGSLTITPVAAPLPVQLADFTAQVQGMAVALAWHTATEVNSDLFEVERSLDDATFTKLGTVASHGTTGRAPAYAYHDALLPTGVRLLYYHLRLVDLDKTATYSPVRTVAVTLTGLALFPNPTTTSSATLTEAAASATVHVLDTLGRLVATTTTDATGAALPTLPTPLSSGIYLVHTGQQSTRLTVE